MGKAVATIKPASKRKKRSSATIIQKWIRGKHVRAGRLPNILYYAQKYIQSHTPVLSNQTPDGRINSSLDESTVLALLWKKFAQTNKIHIPPARMWYDVLLRDELYGWIPVNIKSTTMKSRDNAGNLAMCVYAYTNEPMHLQSSYKNGAMSKVLLKHILDLNQKCVGASVRDYYFIVINKRDTSDIIINSVRGLSHLFPNANNLPFQICWNQNRIFTQKSKKEGMKKFMQCLQNTRPSWRERFLKKCRKGRY